jgi:hypothetical protein
MLIAARSSRDFAATLEAKLVRFDLERARAIDGVIAIIHDGNFVGIVTESEHALFAAMDCGTSMKA